MIAENTLYNGEYPYLSYKTMIFNFIKKRLLNSTKEEINKVGDWGCSPLAIFARKNFPRICSLLCKRGAIIDHRTDVRVLLPLSGFNKVLILIEWINTAHFSCQRWK